MARVKRTIEEKRAWYRNWAKNNPEKIKLYQMRHQAKKRRLQNQEAKAEK